MIEIPDTNYLAMLPMLLVLVGAAIATLLQSRRISGFVALVALLAGALASVALWNKNESAFSASLVLDNFALAVSAALCMGGFLAVLASLDVVPYRTDKLGQSEFYALLLYATSGAMLLVASHNLIVLLIGFEVMSLGVYVLSAFADSRKSEEAGMKYFLLGALASAILIYGIAMIYGATGSFSLEAIATATSAIGFANVGLVGFGALLLLIGFAFKVSLVPFHQWTPDVYEGAPTVVTQFMSVVVKAAAFAGLARILLTALPGVRSWEQPLLFLIAVTLLVGNLAALAQPGLKRMLAYSSIGQAGYIALALLTSREVSWSAIAFYLIAYTFTNAGAFLALQLIAPEDGNGQHDLPLAALDGLATRQPLLAVGLSVCLISLAGIPPLSGFVAKYFAFSAALGSGKVGLVVLAGLMSAVSFYYYLMPVWRMWFVSGSPIMMPVRVAPFTRFALAIAVIATVFLGVYPRVVEPVFALFANR